MLSSGGKTDTGYFNIGGFMEIIQIGSVATAFIRSIEGVNAGMIHTPHGIILIDTTSSPAEAKSLLEAVNVTVEEVEMAINTHFHSDHTWGNQVLTCPILAHRMCQERMQSNLKNEWSPEGFQSHIDELSRTDPKKAEDFRLMVQDLFIKLPDQVFEDRCEGEMGGVKYRVIHLGGHTPDLSVVWLPESKLLFASDLIFQGRYPFIFDADIPLWIDRLSRLLEFDARLIVPGHGVMCREAEIIALREYLQVTWDRTAEHIRMGHSADETASDPKYPIFSDNKYERLHQANIRFMYGKLMG
jgi:glyoxylase-like metal-dependent hydrolase (beta-lactamase superfamily II)